MNEDAMQNTATDLVRSMREMYTMVVGSAFAAQTHYLDLTQRVLSAGLDQLKTQADDTVRVSSVVAEQSQKQRAAMEALTRQSLDAYMGYVNGVMSFYQRGMSAMREATQ